ncbi:MAG: hypothetical protein RI883_2660 [Bacteroidota bacterium]|jgi:uncharacterized protein YdeI (YjbR/CyaY-like superfamily)
MESAKKNKEVTQFLDNQNHPFRGEIEVLRLLILNTNLELTENIKWNGPNYCFAEQDRITIKIQPPKNLQIIFHCGAKVKEQPKGKLIKNDFGLLIWKENNRAVATFNSMQEIEQNAVQLPSIVKEWIESSR